MSGADTLVQIAVLEGSPASAGPGPRAAAALAVLGDQVRIECFDDVERFRARCADDDVSLAVLDRVSAASQERVLANDDPDGPAVVVVTEPDEQAAIDAFRRGADECVAAGPALGDVLPEVVLEQIRERRERHARGAAESRIRRLEELNDAIVAGIPAALAVVDGRERVVTVNPEFSRAFQVDVDRVTGRPFECALPDDLVQSAAVRRLLAETAADRGPAPRLGRTCSEGGVERLFDVRARRLDEDGHLLLVLSDVTDREQLSRRIRDLQRYNENIIQNMNSALLVVDHEGRITFANATAEQILGVGPGGLDDRAVWDWLRAPSPERSLVARTLSEGVRFRGAETVLTQEDGSVVPIGISCAPLAAAGDQHGGAVAIFQDLTEIKHLQRQVLQTEKMASIGQLAAGVAHEINNPTGFIHANLFQMAEYLSDLRKVWDSVERLVETAAAGATQEARGAAEALRAVQEELDFDFVLQDFAKAIRESQEGSERIRHIVQDLREFSHQDTAERVPADVNQCVDSTASIVWTMMKHSVVLQKEYADLPPVLCYPMQLKQVFMNLLVNAYQAIESRVGSSGETGEIHIRSERARGGVAIAIRDTGIGIRAEDLPRIFDPFFTTKEVGAGTGLGLSTSYSIVQRHGGTIRVRSKEGGGTTFEVWLPLGEGGSGRG